MELTKTKELKLFFSDSVVMEYLLKYFDLPEENILSFMIGFVNLILQDCKNDKTGNEFNGFIKSTEKMVKAAKAASEIIILKMNNNN